MVVQAWQILMELLLAGLEFFCFFTLCTKERAVTAVRETAPSGDCNLKLFPLTLTGSVSILQN